MTLHEPHKKIVQLKEELPLNARLINEWKQALTGDQQAQTQWSTNQGGYWNWQANGLTVKSSGTEWSSINWYRFDKSIINNLKNFIIEVTISGKAETAGFSFGHFKDFLSDLDSKINRRHLQLEVDVSADCWAFRVDGRLQNRQWFDSAVQCVDDIINGMFSFKARNVEQVSFQNLTITTFQASCKLTIIMTSYRFLQRLRVSLRNWCQQSLPSGTIEVIVVNPHSPDGTHEHLAAVARSYPHMRICEVSVDPKMMTNKGAMINQAFKVSRGEWIWLTDADCLFSTRCASITLDQIEGQSQHLFYGQRRFLTTSQTDALLTGRIDGMRDFDELCRVPSIRTPENIPWGYTQIVHRTILERVPYREEINHFAHTDGLFVKDCNRHRILPKQVDGLICLHMDHPFAWYGTDIFL